MTARAWMVMAAASIVLGSLARSGHAQPSMTPPGMPPPMQPGMPPPLLALSPEDQALLAEGEMPVMQHAIGTGLAVVVGFGTGQIVEHRWTDTGWIFTLGDAAALAAIIGGIHRLDLECVDGVCTSNGRSGLLVAGVLGAIGLHVWEVVDAVLVPARRNRRVRELRARLGIPPQPRPVSFYLAPGGRDGAVAGFALHF
jgi:hypothetical protein